MTQKEGPQISQMTQKDGPQITQIAQKDGPQISRMTQKEGPQISQMTQKDGPQITQITQKDGPQISRMTQKEGPQISQIAQKDGPQISRMTQKRVVHRLRRLHRFDAPSPDARSGSPPLGEKLFSLRTNYPYVPGTAREQPPSPSGEGLGVRQSTQIVTPSHDGGAGGEAVSS
jgi:hypothetical protein